MATVQLTGGNFQDSEGNVLANGYLKMRLSQDGNVGGVNVCSGIEITIQLDASGDVVASPVQSVWGNDSISPVNTFYRVTGYTAQGQPAWGPNNQQVTGSGTFNLSSWIPNQIVSWTPPLTTVALQHNGVANSSQSVLNLENGSNITITDTGAGGIQIAASVPSALSLKTNGTPNGSQAVLNLKQGSNVTVTDDGVGGITIAATTPTVVIPLNPTGFAGAQGGTTSVNSAGWVLQAFAASGLTLAINNGTNTLPCYLNSPTSSSTGGSNGNYHTSTSNLFSLGQVKRVRSMVRLSQTTNVRVWIGILTEVTGLNSDLPNANIAAFRYSTAAGDVKWQCVTAQDSTHDTIAAETGNHLDATTFHIFEVQFDGTTVTFLIDDTIVGTSTTNLPTNGNLSYYIGIDNVGVAYAPAFDYAWTTIEARAQ